MNTKSSNELGSDIYSADRLFVFLHKNNNNKKDNRWRKNKET